MHILALLRSWANNQQIHINSRHYLKGNAAPWVEKSSTSEAFHTHHTASGFYWLSENALHERLSLSGGMDCCHSQSALKKNQIHISSGQLRWPYCRTKKFRFLLKSDILQSLIHRFWNWKNHSNRTYGCWDIDCQSPGNQQLWQQLSFYFHYFF